MLLVNISVIARSVQCKLLNSVVTLRLELFYLRELFDVSRYKSSVDFKNFQQLKGRLKKIYIYINNNIHITLSLKGSTKC